MTSVELALIGILGCCFIGATTLAVAEVSILRVRRGEILVKAEEGSLRARQLLDLIAELPVVLNTILLLVLLLQVTAATIGGLLADRWFGGTGVTIATVLMTAVLFVYAEAIPKTRAMRSPGANALRLTPLLRLLNRFLRPAVVTLVWLAGRQMAGDEVTVSVLTEQELLNLAEESAEAGEITEDDADLVARSFGFNDRCVGDVMVEGNHIIAVPTTEEVHRALSLAIESGHRRLPVYGSGLHDIVGFVRLRDLAAANRSTPHSTTESIMSEPLRCHPDDLISDLLQRMQQVGLWLAIAEDGRRTMGLATVEDLVAELVGEIDDDRSAVPEEPGS